MSYLEELERQAEEELVERFNKLPIQLTIDDAADFLNISRTTANRMIKMGNIPSYHFAGCKKVYIPKKVFIEWYLNTLKAVEEGPAEIGNIADNGRQ